MQATSPLELPIHHPHLPTTAPHLSMAERVPPPPAGNPEVVVVDPRLLTPHQYPHPPPPAFQFAQPPAPPPSSGQLIVHTNPFAAFGAGTYIVQVPKDQIYRIPPPEHASIVERHQNPANNRRRPLCCSYSCLGILAAIILIVSAIVTTLLVLLAKAKDPKFSVERLTATTVRTHPNYHLILKAKNPNPWVAIIYQDGGAATLHLKNRKIATAKYPSFSQGYGNTTEIRLVMQGADIALPKEIKKSMESSKKKKVAEVTMSLKMKIPARMKMGTLNGRKMRLEVECELTVEALGSKKGSRVVKQECNTRHK